MTKSKFLYALIKVGQRQHMDAIVERGELFMNPVDYFRRVEGDADRGDVDENILRWKQPAGVRVQFGTGPNALSVEAENGLQPISFWSPCSGAVNLFCAYGVFLDNGARGYQGLPSSLSAFGDSACVFTDLPEFVRRFEAAMGVHGSYAHGRVDYVDRGSYDGPMGPFRKFSEFAHQQEYRFALDRKVDAAEPFLLRTGSLSDVAQVVPVERLLGNTWVEPAWVAKRRAKRRAAKQSRQKRKNRS